MIYAGKKEYLNLILKSKKSIKEKLIQIYKDCFKGEIIDLFNNIKFMYMKKNFYSKNRSPLQILKWLILLFVSFFLAMSTLILPKKILFPIIKAYSDIRFKLLEKKI